MIISTKIKHILALSSVLLLSSGFLKAASEFRQAILTYHDGMKMSLTTLAEGKGTIDINKCLNQLASTIPVVEGFRDNARNTAQLREYVAQIGATSAACASNPNIIQDGNTVVLLSDEAAQLIRQARDRFISMPHNSGPEAFLKTIREIHTLIIDAQKAQKKSNTPQNPINPEIQNNPDIENRAPRSTSNSETESEAKESTPSENLGSEATTEEQLVCLNETITVKIDDDVFVIDGKILDVNCTEVAEAVHNANYSAEGVSDFKNDADSFIVQPMDGMIYVNLTKTIDFISENPGTAAMIGTTGGLTIGGISITGLLAFAYHMGWIIIPFAL